MRRNMRIMFIRKIVFVPLTEEEKDVVLKVELDKSAKAYGWSKGWKDRCICWQ